MTISRVGALMFILNDPSNFFNYSQIIDYYIAPPKPATLKQSIDLLKFTISQLETLRSADEYVTPALTLFKLLHKENDGILEFDADVVEHAANSQNLKVVHTIVDRLITNLKKDEIVSIEFEMTMKVFLNVMFILLREADDKNLNEYHTSKDLESLLMKFLKSSLQHSFIPIKKITILFLNHIHLRFSRQFKPTQQMIQTISEWVITEQTVKQSVAQPPLLLRKQKDINYIEEFFAKYNIGECPLAQYIVVGLLRALLNDCNAKPVPNSSGVDVFKEWRCSFIYAIASGKEDLIPVKQIMKEYKLWQETLGNEKDSKNTEKQKQKPKDKQSKQKTFIQDQIDRHRMYTAGAIGGFFTYLLIAFKKNVFLQFTYFIQLMCDANGILVLLKFLTDKFSFGKIKPQQLYSKQNNFSHNFCCILYTILQLLEVSCKNCPEKIKEYLVTYNGFVRYVLFQLIFKKIPPLTNDPLIDGIVHSLLKMQLPYLCKKSKESQANMKLVAEIYCKYPVVQQTLEQEERKGSKSPRQNSKIDLMDRLKLTRKENKLPPLLSLLDRLRLKTKTKPKPPKILTGFQQVKNAHLQFNNHHYWHVQAQQKAQLTQPQKEDLLTRLQRQVQIPTNFDHKKWLQQNVYQMYD